MNRLYKVQCEKVSLEVPFDSTFQDIIDLLNDSKILGFSCSTTGRIICPLESISSDEDIVKIYQYHLVGNLLNAFCDVLQSNIGHYSFVEDENLIKKCIVKFETDNTFSESDFDKYKSSIKEAVLSSKKLSDRSTINSIICENHLSLLPYDFVLEKVAQEKFNGQKIQKFTIAIFNDPKDKEDYLSLKDELKKTDHRYIGKYLEYFMMIPESPGCVFWLPKGWKLYRKLESFIRKYGYSGFREVRTPLVMSNSFWKTSGHLESFKQNMMFVNMGGDANEDSALKPMNCPAHIQIFKQKNRSYKDLPMRIAEFGCCHRYEPSGSLHGLMRVRSLTQDDGHIFCSIEHVKSETSKFLSDCIEVYKKLGFDNVNIILATKPDSALGDSDDWVIAEKYLAESLKEVGLDFSIAEGEGAFYGPKIEMHVKDSIGRGWQLGTIQLDFVLPHRFDLFYVNKEDGKSKVCMLHRAILGSLERFIGVLLEHSKGKLPMFLAPVQVAVCSVIEESNECAEKVHNLFLQSGIESELDIRNETLAYKIREHRTAKIPALAIIGKEEIKGNFITLEYLGKKMLFKLDEISKIMRLFNES